MRYQRFQVCVCFLVYVAVAEAMQISDFYG